MKSEEPFERITDSQLRNEMDVLWLAIMEYGKVADLLRNHKVDASDFLHPDNIYTWSVIDGMVKSNAPITAETFKIAFCADGKHTVIKALDILDCYVIAETAEYHITELKKARQKRELKILAHKIAQEEGEIEEIIVSAIGALSELESKFSPDTAKVAKFRDFKERIRAHITNKNQASGFSTGWNTLDEYWKHKPGNLVIVTGVPMSGKSEWLDQIVINAINKHGWKFCIFSPENYPPEFHFQKLAEKLIGKPMFEKWGKQAMSMDDLKKSMDKLSEHITVITPEESGLSIDAILNKIRMAKKLYGCDVAIIDPYNEVEHKRNTKISETEYISEFLSKVRNFGRLHDIEMIVVAHPTKLPMQDDGEYKVPSLYDISGSANFRNKADIGITIWRSYQRKDNLTEVHITKVRDKNIGRLGKVIFEWDYATGTYCLAQQQERK